MDKKNPLYLMGLTGIKHMLEYIAQEIFHNYPLYPNEISIAVLVYIGLNERKASNCYKSIISKSLEKLFGRVCFRTKPCNINTNSYLLINKIYQKIKCTMKNQSFI